MSTGESDIALRYRNAIASPAPNASSASPATSSAEFVATPVADASCRNRTSETPATVDDPRSRAATRAVVGVSFARTRVSAAARVDADASTGVARIAPRRVSSVSSERRNPRCRCPLVVVTATILPAGTDTEGDPVPALRSARGRGSGDEFEHRAVGGAHNGEVAVVHGGDGGDIEAFGDRDD